ncbi:MAG: aminopeptidase N [Planctomycetes bacterium]|nr:aminopeptidase N [Planctomycetota bacterium]
MSDTKIREKFRRDYRPPAYRIDTVALEFELDPARTIVRAKLACALAAAEPGTPFVLDGEELELLSIALDGRSLQEGEYVYDRDARRLTLPVVPHAFTLETVVAIAPEKNTHLSGLYTSSGNFCTQCEAEGFRRITFFPDRPDVMARFTTALVADPKRYPVLLSNGNPVEERTLPDGRRRVVWVDPAPKPCYLFALVAGDLRCHAGSFTTRSGRVVRTEIWVEEKNLDKCAHSLHSLHAAMAWDEQRFGLEYDLDIYMIVAVDDFNMGAMENKGLNIFNSKYVLARPDTATDDDYEHIEGVVAHEYFHNWTGNRVTCRDWFQLTLKEGLTVFRDQLFSADQGSAAVKRISDVRALRAAQFPEDAGPMAHPIRPESYLEMNNFYTATVYEKGAEVIRMLHTLLGEQGFRRGMDLYFQRHDGHAVTCDDFVAALANANGRDLAQFRRWYSTPTTPRLELRGTYDAARQTYTLRCAQSLPKLESAGQSVEPLHLPIAVGLLRRDGSEIPLRLDGEPASAAATTRVLELTERAQEFRFVGVDVPPVPSLLRNFSAPVKLEAERSREEIAFLAARDRDPFQRWDAGQELSLAVLKDAVARAQRGESLVLDPALTLAFRATLADPALDPALKALALALPSESLIGQEYATIDVDAIHRARAFVVRELARALRAELHATYEELRPRGPYSPARPAIQRRRLANTALRYLAALEEPTSTALVHAHYERADNMTDAQAALALLCDLPSSEREAALADFHRKWQREPLVLDKWFTVQALSQAPDALERVRSLRAHPDFRLENPNRARALLGAFGMSNPAAFHDAAGAGYRLLADAVLELDAKNPQVASRLVSAFNAWKRYDASRAALQQAELSRIAAHPGLSRDVSEIVGRALRA